MKKSFSIILLGILIVMLLVGCGASNNNPLLDISSYTTPEDVEAMLGVASEVENKDKDNEIRYIYDSVNINEINLKVWYIFDSKTKELKYVEAESVDDIEMDKFDEFVDMVESLWGEPKEIEKFSGGGIEYNWENNFSHSTYVVSLYKGSLWIRIDTK